MNKKQMSEQDIRTKYITPAILAAGWDRDLQIREEVSFTKGKITVRRKIVKRGEQKRADYILYWKPNIEFKNGQVNNRNIKDKARDSLLVFLEIIGENIAFSRSNIDFIVVYNLEKNPLPKQVQKGQLQETPSRVSIADHFMGKARKEFICFDLERYERLYYRNIHTYSKERFGEYLQALKLG